MALSMSNEFQQDTIIKHSPSMKPQKKSKPLPLVLCNTEVQYWPLPSPLAEFAAIATSPESPLVKEMSCDNGTRNNAFKLPSIEHVTPSTDMRTSDLSSCSETRSLTWPSSTSLWERFNEQSASQTDSISDTHYSSAQYTILHRDNRSMAATKTSSLFRPHNIKNIERELSNVDENTSFYRTPWSQYYTNDNSSCLGLSCRELLLGDVCIPLSNARETTSQNENAPTKTQDTKPSVLFDLDSAAQALSNMAKRKEEHVEYQRKLESTLKIVKSKGTRIRKRKNANSTARRPMNAFMLFAKRYRLEITRKHPGKDNRAISVILGDEWKSLSSEDRKVYILEAKSLAEEHKRIYPDCWKRKRTTQVSSRTNRKH